MSKQRPFFDTLRHFFEAKGFTDLAPSGTASQSSVSKWSSINDAQRAVSNLQVQDFAFHTELEDAPWWEVEFKLPISAQAIVVLNRKRTGFQSIARSIKVEILDNDEPQLLHKGLVEFGCADHGVPLVLPLPQNRLFRKLRISLEERGYLHLSGVHIFGKGQDGHKNRTNITFSTERLDGFGERIKGMLNAMVVANYYGCSFSFEWPEFSRQNANHHSVEPFETVFSSNFIDTYYGNFQSKITLRSLVENDANLEPNIAKSQTGENVSVIVPHGELKKAEPKLTSFIENSSKSNFSYQDAFRKIEFTDALMDTIKIAENLDIGNEAVAIHLRAGDIIYGRYRFNGRYSNKVVPYPLCEAFVQAERSEGREVLLFGQDTDYCRQLADAFGATSAENFHRRYNFNKMQATLFDIVAMSRCTRVIAGQSGFSQLAQRIGGFTMIDPRELMAPEEAAIILCDVLLGKTGASGVGSVMPSKLQRSFAAWYTVQHFGNWVSPQDKAQLLKIAMHNDPTNAFYRVIYAVTLFENKSFEIAENILELLIEERTKGETFGTLKDVTHTVHPDGKPALAPALYGLEKMAKAGSKSAAIIAAIVYRKTEKKSLSGEMRQLAGSKGEVIITSLDGKILK